MMKKKYIAPALDCLHLTMPGVICASTTVTLHSRDAVRGEEADSKGYNGSLLWDDTEE